MHFSQPALIRPGEKFKSKKRKTADDLIDASGNRAANDADEEVEPMPMVGAAACVQNTLTSTAMVIEATPMALRTPREAAHLLK